LLLARGHGKLARAQASVSTRAPAVNRVKRNELKAMRYLPSQIELGYGLDEMEPEEIRRACGCHSSPA
jgi:hypothetical protein